MESVQKKIDKFQEYLDGGFNSLEFVKYLEILDEIREYVGTNIKNPSSKSTMLEHIDDVENCINEGNTRRIPLVLELLKSMIKSDTLWVQLQKIKTGGKKKSKKKYSRKLKKTRKRSRKSHKKRRTSMKKSRH